MLNDPILEIAIKAAGEGAAITRKYFSNLESAKISNKLVGSQGSDKDEGFLALKSFFEEGLVTRADVESEQAIIASIQAAFPDHQFLAEEEHAFQASLDAEHLWIIDPLDGTNNFANGIAHYAVSVAYYRDGEPYCGVILAPESDDCFSAVQGRGAWHNGRLVRVNKHRNLNETMVGVGFYYDRGEMMRDTLNAIEKLFSQNVIGIRRMGTAALDLVQVGLGRFGGFFEYTLSPWDFAAGQLFVTEAGGRVTTCGGNRVPITKSSILASNGLLHESIMKELSAHHG